MPKKGRHSVGVARQYCGMLGKTTAERRAKAGVPEEVRFATKTQIALQQLRALLAQGAPHHCLADAGYGVDTAFRQALSNMGLAYAVGVTSAVAIWPPGVRPLPPPSPTAVWAVHP